MTATPRTRRFGVILLNMGGPLTLDDVEPFLVELLSDPLVMSIPIGVLRRRLARRIARKRAPQSAERYAQIGGGSPLLEQTRAQAEALEAALADRAVPVGIAMRYTAPRAENALVDMIKQGVTDIIALPLYPQFARATSGSSLLDLRQKATALGLACHEISAYPILDGFIDAVHESIQAQLDGLTQPVILFSAHGLPERQAKKDDYPAHIGQSVAAVAERLPAGMRHELAFQSRLGPVAWMQPYLDERVRSLAREGVTELVVVPISFVSEHIETLHELDIELKETALSAGMTAFRRARTVGAHPAFIAGLAQLARARMDAVIKKDTP